MKKIGLCILTFIITATLLVGCSSGGATEPSTTESTVEASVETTESTTAAE